MKARAMEAKGRRERCARCVRDGDACRSRSLAAVVCDLYVFLILFFFFQAEDGIRDYKVTRVQTCALPIYRRTAEREGGSVTTAEPLALIDHHVHGAVTGALDRPGFEALLTEGPGPRPPGTTMFESP